MANGQKEVRREVLWASLGVLLVLLVVKHVGRIVPGGWAPHIYTMGMAFQLYLPIYVATRAGQGYERLGLTLKGLRTDLGWALGFACVTLVLFAAGHHLWQTLVYEKVLSPRWPDISITDVLVEFGVVALAEEVYFRGYLQPRMRSLWGGTRKIFGVPFGWPEVAATAVFALAHWVGEYSLLRLGPFFPGLIFAWLRGRTDRVVAPVLYHGLCNLMSRALFFSYS